MRILYINADESLDKRQDLKLLINSLSVLPDVIAITEFKPKKIIPCLLVSLILILPHTAAFGGLSHAP